ncbi:hypothetical protein BAUCODRAFT_124404 [Baudoinia panamericana UAMH 10762]|uniref:Uncharacterized protein n=1 Tax=Baudoinia panamericana (strain UAMH 10762) TaxID=717646 RepID=M2MTE9_BAUPA|nr:uncharacterized protein BAUCODRAFT_124404 [Baudoinia panamericana UAMH 10762]EMC94813.1 hypothetical protein BAUCODRAFT_124404 [Baudoinia panamericana UAMH 10762]
MQDVKLRDTVFVFTDSQTEHNECMGDYTNLALGEDGRRFYSVILHCEEAGNEHRLAMAGRGRGLIGKLTDVEILRRYRREGDGIWRFGDDDELEIDLTHLSSEDAARTILAFVVRREKEGRRWNEDELP